MLSSALRRIVAAIVATLALGAAASTALAADPVVMAAGDVACSSQGITTPGDCSQRYTAGLAVAQLGKPEGLAALLAIGDLQYDSGGLSGFRTYFGAADSWGQPALRPVLRPVPGNHEYLTSGASGYFGYFAEIGVGVGTPGQGWYSFDVGGWHFIALNSSDGCSKAVKCAKGSPQETWLANDLATNTKPCVAAYLHHPVNTVGGRLHDIWQDLYDAGVELVLVGHNHGYTKIVHRNASGAVDPAGPGEIVVGTGGKSSGVYGLLKMTLQPTSMTYAFVGSGASDTGSLSCDASPPPPPPPPPPTPPAAKFSASLSGRTLTVTDESTGGLVGASWAWDFGDGATSTLRYPAKHTYAADGTYTVKLTVTAPGGTSTAAPQTIKVSTAPPPTPDPTPDPSPKPEPVVQPVVGPDPAPAPPVVEEKAVTPPSVVTVTSAPTLTAAKARAALRALLTRRLRGWTLTAVTCRTSDAGHARCTFRARLGDRRASGSGTLALLGADGHVSVTVQATLTGRLARRTTWTGRVRS